VVVVIYLGNLGNWSQIVCSQWAWAVSEWKPWLIGTQNSRTVQSLHVLGRSKSSFSLWPLIISVKMKLSSESCFFREIWWVILCRTLICFQTKIPLRLFIRIRGSTKTHPTILGMTFPYLDDRSRSTRKKVVFFSLFATIYVFDSVYCTSLADFLLYGAKSKLYAAVSWWFAHVVRAVYQTEGCLQIGLVNRDKVQLECRKLSPFRCYLLSVNIESKIIKVKLGSMRPLPSAQREERGWFEMVLLLVILAASTWGVGCSYWSQKER